MCREKPDTSFSRCVEGCASTDAKSNTPLCRAALLAVARFTAPVRLSCAPLHRVQIRERNGFRFLLGVDEDVHHRQHAHDQIDDGLSDPVDGPRHKPFLSPTHRRTQTQIASARDVGHEGIPKVYANPLLRSLLLVLEGLRLVQERFHEHRVHLTEHLRHRVAQVCIDGPNRRGEDVALAYFTDHRDVKFIGEQVGNLGALTHAQEVFLRWSRKTCVTSGPRPL
mmetsp:Transcript_29541/g.78137  ORF Transcript_29541/g.78137 Transcript_29541/m.78137 type:complete len:224 (+) Transcript_29541:132-803(+)